MISVKVDVPFFVLMFAALNISEVIGFQEGFFEATLLKISAIEATGDVRGAFLLAISLKALDFKVNNSHDVYANSTVLTPRGGGFSLIMAI